MNEWTKRDRTAPAHGMAWASTWVGRQAGRQAQQKKSHNIYEYYTWASLCVIAVTLLLPLHLLIMF